jgi:hypothetical protein
MCRFPWPSVLLVLIHWKSLPENLAVEDIKAVSRLPRPESASSLTAAFSADMIAGRKSQSRGENF